MTSDDVTIQIKLSDGRVLSGTYPYLQGMARIEAAQQQPNCVSATWAWAAGR